MGIKRKGKYVFRGGETYFKVPTPVIKLTKSGKPAARHNPEKWGSGWLVQYPTGYRYNGGIIVNDKLVAGFVVDPPKLPDGYRLQGIGVGLEMNSRPPMLTKSLIKET